MPKWSLTYNDCLSLTISDIIIENFCSGAFYKLRLKRYVSKILNDTNTIIFRVSLTYLDFKKIIELCKNEALKLNIQLNIDNSVTDYINARELYLESRSRLGVELKNHDEKLTERFMEYRSLVNTLMNRKLREQQMWDSFFMCAMRKSGNFSVPGSGKTSSVLGMYAYLKAKNMVKRVVVICPKNAFGSWIDEFTICFNGKESLNCFNIHDTKYKDTADKKRSLRFNSGLCNLILLNYESLSTYSAEVDLLIDNQTLLVFDEVHKVKRIGGLNASYSIRAAFSAYYTVVMTGTPIPNTYKDIYNFLHILFPDEYDEFFDFSPALLSCPSEENKKEINDTIQPFFCRTTKRQLNVPDANPDVIINIAADDIENRILRILQMKYRKNKLALIIRILQLESNSTLLLNSLDLNDFRYLLDESEEIDEIDFADYSEEIQNLIKAHGETSKFKKCMDLVIDLVEKEKPVIIWCIFVDSINRFHRELKKYGIESMCIYGEVPLENRQQILSDFKLGTFNVLLTNPHTLAESVSLHSICHDAIYFEYSYNLVHLLQSKDRIHRLGLPTGQYTQYFFTQLEYETENGKWSMGSAIYDRLLEKEKTMLEAIDNHILESMPTSEEDLEKIFEQLK